VELPCERIVDLEVKLKGRRERTIKARLPYAIADRTRLTPQAHAFLLASSKRRTASPCLGSPPR
jgi:hypothetical protein